VRYTGYKAQIPSLFHSNALLVISDGHQAKLGTITSDWERFITWRTITGKELVPPGSLQLETLLKGVFDKHRLLDLIRNFVVFEDDGEKVLKKLAGYHQFHAVNKLQCKRCHDCMGNPGRAGMIRPGPGELEMTLQTDTMLNRQLQFKTAFRWLRRADAEIGAPLLDAALSRKSMSVCRLTVPTNH